MSLSRKSCNVRPQKPSLGSITNRLYNYGQIISAESQLPSLKMGIISLQWVIVGLKLNEVMRVNFITGL